MGFRTVLLFAFFGFLAGGSGSSQTPEKSPSALIRFLTYQADRPGKQGVANIFIGCGAARAEYMENRQAADALVKIGAPALTGIERAFESIRGHGRKSVFALNSEWLLDAYARIKGATAYPSLRRMRSNPNFAFLQKGLDDSTAVSFGLTSYVSGSRVLATKATCSGVFEPKDLLDQLILGWERNDRQWVEASLGGNATAALTSLLSKKTWAKMRADVWRGNSSGDVAVGYRFEVSGWWQEREQPLQIDPDARRPVNPELDTLFTNSSGGDCGRHRVTFLMTEESREITYLVNNADIEDLLRLIASCAAERPSQTP